jgi:hypothetical protein
MTNVLYKRTRIFHSWVAISGGYLYLISYFDNKIRNQRRIIQMENA